MAGSVNKIILVGNLGKDPEIRTLNSGDRVANLRVATGESWRDKVTGERKEKTEWHQVVIFNENLVKIAENYLRKGSTIYIEGALQTRKYTDSQGAERYVTEIVLQKYRGELTMLGGKSANTGSEGGYIEHQDSSTDRLESSPTAKDSDSNFTRDLDDDIPF